jgi:hypothetical protein
MLSRADVEVGPQGCATATDWGLVPAAKGEPVIGVSAPVVGSTVYAETLLAPLFTT